MKPTLVVLAAGMWSRYGGLKQVDSFGPHGETIVEYAVYDAIQAWFGKIVFIIREEFDTLFREKVSSKIAADIEIIHVYQPLDISRETSIVRTKPWGTIHALLMTQDVVREPFAVINADDYYGPSWFTTIATYLQDIDSDNCCLVGYTLAKTLSDKGSVNRWICWYDHTWGLSAVVEHRGIVRNQDTHICDDNGVLLQEDAVASMNFWWFHPTIFPLAQEIFDKFVEHNADHPTAEIVLTDLVDTLIREQKIGCHVLHSDDQWYGITYQEDKAAVQQACNQFHEIWIYPTPLRG